MKLLIGLHSLPETNPLARLAIRIRKKFTSRLQKMAAARRDIPTDGVETIAPYVVSPWEARVLTVLETERVRATGEANRNGGIRIATSSSARDGTVGMGGPIDDNRCGRLSEDHYTYSPTLGPRTEQLHRRTHCNLRRPRPADATAAEPGDPCLHEEPCGDAGNEAAEVSVRSSDHRPDLRRHPGT